MKSLFTRLILSVLLAASLAYTPKKAEAGVLLMSSPAGAVIVLGEILCVTSALAIAPYMMGGAGHPVINTIALAAVGLFVLDDSQSNAVDVDSLANFLAIRYPQINDPAFFDELSTLIASKINLNDLSYSADDHVRYGISEDELDPVLALLHSTGIEEEISRLIRDLE